jgi:DNA-binding NarL/FixJ family response regulator
MIRTSIFIADDHPIVRDGVKSILSGNNNYNVIGEAETGPKTLHGITNLAPDLVIMDISMPELDGILVTERVTKEFPDIKVIMLSMHKERQYAINAFRAGAKGYILKGRDSNEILIAVNKVASNQIYVSPPLADEIMSDFANIVSGEQFMDPFGSMSLREKEVVKLVTEGCTSKEIAEKLYLSISTIKTYRSNIMRKLKVKDTAGLIKLAIQKGLVEL